MIVSVILLGCLVTALLLGILQDKIRIDDMNDRVELLETKMIHEYEPLIKLSSLEKRIDEPLFFDLDFENYIEDFDEDLEG